MIEIKNAHEDDIIEFNHCYDKNNKRDIIMSVSPLNTLKIWNAKNWECLLFLTKINSTGLLSSSCFIKNNDECNIVTSNSHYGVGIEEIKIFNLQGVMVKKIKNSNDSTLFIDTYYDYDEENIKTKTYIIVALPDCIKSYDYNENKLYHKYYEEKNNGHHFSFVINKNKNNGLISLIEPCSSDGFIRIWNFHYGHLLSKIKTKERICSLCLWNNKYLFAGTLNGKIILIDLINQIVDQIMENAHNNWVNCIKKFRNDTFGECLVSQGFDDQIIFWSNKA
jgi:WD40 repeat protein